jgi:hypothetical protein
MSPLAAAQVAVGRRGHRDGATQWQWNTGRRGRGGTVPVTVEALKTRTQSAWSRA